MSVPSPGPFSYVDPARCAEWDASLAAFAESGPFHTAAWASTLRESYGFRPQYLLCRDGGGVKAMIPLMEVDSMLTGRRGGCLPFTDLCPPLLAPGASLAVLFEELARHGRERGWRTLELRGVDPGQFPGRDSSLFLAHELDLTPDEDILFRGLSESTRRNIRKARAQGVVVVESPVPEGMHSFQRLNGLTRREHGLPPQPSRFFRRLLRNIIEPGRGRLLLATHGGTPIAGAVFLHHHDRVVYKYGASDRSRLDLRPNDLVMWEAIRSYAALGARRFHFGRTEPDNVGLIRFKRGWGAREQTVHYYRLDLASGRFVSAAPKVRGWHNELFSRTPQPLLNALGTVLYRHMG